MHWLVTLWLLDFKTQWPHQSWTCNCSICSLPTNSLHQYYSSKCTQISRPESSLFPSLVEPTATPQPDFHYTVLFRLNTTFDIVEAKHIATALRSALCRVACKSVRSLHLQNKAQAQQLMISKTRTKHWLWVLYFHACNQYSSPVTDVWADYLISLTVGGS